MTYCLDTYVIRDPNCIGHCCKSGNIPDKIRIAYEAGYTGVELWHPDIVKYVQHGGTLDALANQISWLGLSVPSYKVVNNFLETGDETHFNEVMWYASQLKASSVVVKMIKDDYRGPCPDETTICKRYEKLLKRGVELGVKPSLEFMSCSPYYNSIDAAWRIVKAVDHPYASVVLDTFHLWRVGDNQFDAFAESIQRSGITGDKVSVVHFTDTSKDVPQKHQNDGHRRLPGLGQLNLARFARLLGSIKYRGALSLNTYDQSLWHRDPLEVATEGYYRMNQSFWGDEFETLVDSMNWRGRQDIRCDGLWTKDYLTHLDPRVKPTDRDAKLEELLKGHLEGKKVMDFKCGFSPLAKYVSVGFDAYEGCIEYLKRMYPGAEWYAEDDDAFSKRYDKKIDVLLHIGLGDSDTEVESNLRVRKKCKPELVILECCANDDGTVNNAKAGSAERWERLKEGLVGECIVYKTNMPKRPTRLLFVGRPEQSLSS